MTYRPLQKFTQDRIAPTEEDDAFRQDLIQGIVHDPVAALYGGVAGNSGLFSNANDLAIVLQMTCRMAIMETNGISKRGGPIVF